MAFRYLPIIPTIYHVARVALYPLRPGLDGIEMGFFLASFSQNTVATN